MIRDLQFPACPFRVADACTIATSLAVGRPVVPHATACEFCAKRAEPRRAVNRVTVTLAIGACRASGDQSHAAELARVYRDLLPEPSNPSKAARLQAILTGHGSGSELWRLLSSLGVDHRDSCECLSWAERMNAWGVDGCRRSRPQIVAHMRASAADYGWGDVGTAIFRAITSDMVLRLNPLDPYGSLVDEAIRRAALAVEPSPIDLLIPLGTGSTNGNLEIRLALRSIERHAVGLRRVIVVGAIPAFLRETDRVQLVRFKEFKCNKASRISLKIKWVFENLDVTDRLAFWNDDYLMLRDKDIRTIPDHYRGDLWRRGKDGWCQLLNHTAETLRAAGRPQRHYDIHVPIIYEREKFLGLDDWWERSRRDKKGLVAKSIYGNNHCHATAVPTKDCKLKGNWKGRIKKPASRRWVLSYGDAALSAGLADWMLQRFPEPCAAEVSP